MKIIKYLIVLFLALNSYGQETEKIGPFYLEEITAFKAFYENSTEYNAEKLNQIFKEINSLPKVTSANSKSYIKNDKSVFEIYKQKDISLKVVTSSDKKDCIIYLYSNGIVEHEIPYLNNKVTGVYKVFLSNGSLLSETEYKEGKRNGVRKFYPISENRIIEGDFIDGKITGTIKVSEPENNRFILFPNNLKNGKVEYYDVASNLLCEVPILEGNIVHGEVIDYFYNSNAKRLVRNHRMGKLDGKTEYFDENGNSKCILNFKEGKPIGAHKEFYLNGKIYRETFYSQDGAKIGTWKTFDESGKLKNEISYVNDNYGGVENVYYNGFLVGYREYKDGKLNGAWKNWNSVTTKLEYEDVFKDGIRLNTIRYFNDGKISTKLEFNSKGQVISSQYYDKKGIIFYEKKYNAKKSSEGIHKIYLYGKDEEHFLYAEEEFDDNEFRIREKLFMPNEEYIETIFQPNGSSIKTILKNKTTVTEYYLQSRKISLQEFNKFHK